MWFNEVGFIRFRLWLEKVMQNNLKRMQDIELKIASLKGEQAKIEQELANELLSVLKKQQALGLDFNALVGGLLYVIDNLRAKSEVVEAWQQAGAKFCKPHKSKAPVPEMA